MPAADALAGPQPGEAADIAVIGLGYIGLPTAAALATRGLPVIGVDTDAERVAAVNRGEVPFVEPDLADAVAEAVSSGMLRAQRHVPVATTYVIAVPTPFTAERQADLGHVNAVVESLAPTLRPGALIILESTSPPGTTRSVAGSLARLRPDLRFPGAARDPDVHLAHCPERVLPGRIMLELRTNDRVVGGLTPECAARAAGLYRKFCDGEILLTDATTAEMAKLAENAYRDVNIAFANELSLIADRLGVDVWEVIAMANRHPRVGILKPGPGVGGHCIAVDPWFLVAAAPDDARLIRTAREVNDDKPRRVVAQVLAGASGKPAPTIAALGLSYKADIDDLRESPAVEIVEQVARALPGAEVFAVEPNIAALPATLRSQPNVRLAALRDAVAAADVVVVLVDHAPFTALDRNLLAGKAVVDTRGIWR